MRWVESTNVDVKGNQWIFLSEYPKLFKQLKLWSTCSINLVAGSIKDIVSIISLWVFFVGYTNKNHKVNGNV